MGAQQWSIALFDRFLNNMQASMVLVTSFLPPTAVIKINELFRRYVDLNPLSLVDLKFLSSTEILTVNIFGDRQIPVFVTCWFVPIIRNSDSLIQW